MPFGPFKLVDVRISYDNLVLDLANEQGDILFSPKRKLRYGQSDEAKRHAEGLIGSLVTTETYDPIKWPSTLWWVSVSKHSEKEFANSKSILKVFDLIFMALNSLGPIIDFIRDAANLIVCSKQEI